MTKKEWDKFTKENLGSKPEAELRHILRTKRARPSGGTTALAPNEFYGRKEDPFHKRINKRKPLQHAKGTVMRLIGAGKGSSKLRALLFEFEHPLPGNLKYRDRRLT